MKYDEQAKRWRAVFVVYKDNGRIRSFVARQKGTEDFLLFRQHGRTMAGEVVYASDRPFGATTPWFVKKKDIDWTGLENGTRMHPTED